MYLMYHLIVQFLVILRLSSNGIIIYLQKIRFLLNANVNVNTSRYKNGILLDNIRAHYQKPALKWIIIEKEDEGI